MQNDTTTGEESPDTTEEAQAMHLARVNSTAQKGRKIKPIQSQVYHERMVRLGRLYARLAGLTTRRGRAKLWKKYCIEISHAKKQFAGHRED